MSQNLRELPPLPFKIEGDWIAVEWMVDASEKSKLILPSSIKGPKENPELYEIVVLGFGPDVPEKYHHYLGKRIICHHVDPRLNASVEHAEVSVPYHDRMLSLIKPCIILGEWTDQTNLNFKLPTVH